MLGQYLLYAWRRGEAFSIALPGNTKVFREQGTVAFAGQDWFNMFDHRWLAGAADPAPNTAVISRRLAHKYFGSEAVLGKVLTVNAETNVRITGLLGDTRGTSDWQAELLLSPATMRSVYPDMYKAFEEEWGWINPSNALFVQLDSRENVSIVNNFLQKLAQSHMGEVAKYYKFHLVALTALHFDTRYGGPISRSLL